MQDASTAGAWFAGRYELHARLGRGGMAAVYRAWDHVAQRPCAVKILSEALSEDDQFRQRFQQEATAARALTHPGIVRVDDWGEAGARHFLVMEYVAGGSLRDLLGRSGPLPQPAALRIAAEVADALSHAHARGVIHRDIKPENLLLDEEGRIKVADFGIARTVDAAALTRTGTVMGSARYLSPEQARGQPAGPGSDLYALGVVLFEMLAGRAPFEGDNPVAIAVQHAHEPAPRLAQCRPDVAAPVAAVVERLLAKHEQDRYPTAAALAEDLRRHIAALRSATGSYAGPCAATALHPASTAQAVDETLRLHAGNPTEQWSSQTSLLNVEDVAAAGPATAALPLKTRAATSGRPAPDDPARERGRSATRRPPAYLRPAAVVAALLALAAAIGMQGYRSGHSDVAVPALMGQSITAASQTVQTMGLRLVVTARRQDGRVPAGMIIAQDRPPGARVAQNAAVGVVVSQGSGIVPELRGLPFDENARRLVEAAGLHLKRIGVTGPAPGEDAAAGGVIVSQLEAPGTQLAPDANVNVMVAPPAKGGPENPPPENPAPAVAPAPAPAKDKNYEKN